MGVVLPGLQVLLELRVCQVCQVSLAWLVWLEQTVINLAQSLLSLPLYITIMSIDSSYYCLPNSRKIEVK